MSELLQFILTHEDAFKSHTRLTSLYSDFALLKDTNPDGYAANVYAWRSALEKACRAGLTPVPIAPQSAGTCPSSIVLQVGEGLVKQLESKELGRPLALGAVVDDALSGGHLIPLQAFLESKIPLTSQRRSRKSWIPIPTPYDVARWLLAQTGLFASNASRLSSGEYVVLKNIEEATSAITRRVAEEYSTSSSLVYSLQTFRAAFAAVLPDAPPLSSLDITILLTYLSRDKNAVSLSRPTCSPSASTEDTDKPLTIKFAPPVTNAAPLLITQQDTTIASLKTLEYNLSIQIEALEQRVSQLNISLQAAIPKSSASTFEKSRAISLLCQKKGIESTLQRRLDSQTQVGQTLTSIDDAVTNVEMTKAMEASAGVLENLNKQVGGAEGVARVMDRLANARADQEEIGRVLQQDAEADVDDESVEEELEAMLRESQPEKKEQSQGQNEEPLQPKQETQAQTQSNMDAVLPEVPSTEPGNIPGPAAEAIDQSDTSADPEAENLEECLRKLSLGTKSDEQTRSEKVEALDTTNTFSKMQEHMQV